MSHFNAELYVDVEFEAAHSLPFVGPKHKCFNVHGHSYKVRLYAYGAVDEQHDSETQGMVIDYDAILTCWHERFHRQLDHRLLNDIKALHNPTAENLCRFILKGMPEYVTAVRVREAPYAGCLVRREDIGFVVSQ